MPSTQCEHNLNLDIMDYHSQKNLINFVSDNFNNLLYIGHLMQLVHGQLSLCNLFGHYGVRHF